jgi:hypothetical protein
MEEIESIESGSRRTVWAVLLLARKHGQITPQQRKKAAEAAMAICAGDITESSESFP